MRRACLQSVQFIFKLVHFVNETLGLEKLIKDVFKFRDKQSRLQARSAKVHLTLS